MGSTIVEQIRADSERYIATAEQAYARGDKKGVKNALLSAIHLEKEARLREAAETAARAVEDAELEALLVAAFDQPSGVRTAPGLESLRTLIENKRSA